jgi:hypothetical protein
MRTPTHRYSETLRTVAPILAELKNGSEALQYLVRWERDNGTTQSDFDIAAALYWVGIFYHDGQFSALYRLACATGFKPGVCQRGPDMESVEGTIFDELITILGMRGIHLGYEQ